MAISKLSKIKLYYEYNRTIREEKKCHLKK